MKKLLFLILFLFFLPGFVLGQAFYAPGAASTTVKGTVELATDAETVTGTATDKVTTPANVKAGLTNTGYDVGIGSTTAGKNLTVNATLGDELITWTDAGWNEDGATWTFAASTLTHVAGNTTTVTAAGITCEVGKTYPVRFVGTGGGGTATYTLGGVTGTTIPASGAFDFTDYITASTTASLIITPSSACTVAISSISVKLQADNTGDLTVDGNLRVKSQILAQTMEGSGSGNQYPQFSFNNDFGTGIGKRYGGIIDFYSSYVLVGRISSASFVMPRDSFFIGLGTSTDAILGRDAANTWAQKNSTTQQVFRIYNTADAVWATLTNYERASLTGVAGSSINLTAETGGTGADNLDIVLTPAGTGVVTTPANIYTSGDCSALTFTDRTPYYDGDALSAIKLIKGKDGKIDHESLPEFARRTTKHTVVNSVIEEKIPVSVEDAFEEIDVDVQVTEDKVPIIDKTEIRFELVNGVVTQTEKPIYKTRKEKQKKLKDGVVLDEKTGTFYKNKTTIDKTETEEPGRDLGAMISILVKANQQLLERVEQLEKK